MENRSYQSYTVLVGHVTEATVEVICGVDVARITLSTRQMYRKYNGELKAETTNHSVAVWQMYTDVPLRNLSVGDAVRVEGHWHNQKVMKGYGKYINIREIFCDHLTFLGKKREVKWFAEVSQTPLVFRNENRLCGALDQPFKGGNGVAVTRRTLCCQPMMYDAEYLSDEMMQKIAEDFGRALRTEDFEDPASRDFEYFMKLDAVCRKYGLQMRKYTSS